MKTIKSHFYLLLSLILLKGSLLFGQDTWLSKTSLTGESRQGAIAFSINGKGYLGLGYNGSYKKDLWEYDPTTETWTQKADIPGSGRSEAVIIPLGNDALVATGYNGNFLKDVWSWSSTTNTWSQKNDFTGSQRQGAVGFTLAGNGYLGLGYNGTFLNDFYQYNSVTDTWVAKSNYPAGGRAFCAVFTTLTHGYVGLGYNAGYQSQLYAYDPATDSWSQKSNFPGSARAFTVSYTLNNQGWVGTGDNGVSTLKDFWLYNPSFDAWVQKASLPGNARRQAAAFVIGNNAYVVSGSTAGPIYFNDLWQWNGDYCNLNILPVVQHISCPTSNNGSISITASSSYPPYTFNWSTGSTSSSISNLSTGTYTVNIKDAANCTYQGSWRIDTPTPISFGVDTNTWGNTRKIGGQGADAIIASVYDASGNHFVTGTFSGSATFGSNTLISNGGTDVFLAAYNSSGVIQWVRQIGGTNNDAPTAIAINNAGEITISGYFTDYAVFGTLPKNSQGGEDIFIARYSSLGSQMWARTAGGALNDRATGMFIDNNDNIYLTGAFEGAAQFGNQTLVANGGKDIFVVKWNSAGIPEWIAQAGTSSTETGTAIVADNSGNVYVTGTMQSSLTIGSTTLTGAGANDIFLAAYDRYGSPIWAKNAGGAFDDYPSSMIINNNQLVITGWFGNTATFGSQTLTSNGGLDVFASAWSLNGTHAWAVRAGGLGDDKAYAINSFTNHEMVFVGSFSGSATFGTETLTSKGGLDLFACRIDKSGSILKTIAHGGGGNEIAYTVSTSSPSTLLIGGSFTQSLSFGSTLLVSSGQTDGFYSKTDIASKYIAPIVNKVTCPAGNDGSIFTKVTGGTKPYTYLWNTGATTDSLINLSTGNYSLHITDANGCTKDTTFVISTKYNLPVAPLVASTNRDYFCETDAGNITISVAGGSGDTLKWYYDNACTQLMGKGSPLTILSPDTTTIYYARWENPCGVSSAIALTVHVLMLPTPAISISNSNPDACAGIGNVTLTVTGGSGDIFRWYTNSCGGTYFSEGNSLSIGTPLTTTVLYGRWESSCGVSECKQVIVHVNALAEKPTSITATQTEVCFGSTTPITLTAVGGSGTTLKWTAGSCGSTPIWIGNQAIITPPATTTKYFAYYENICNTSPCDSITITVKPLPVTPTSATASSTSFCKGTLTNITLTAVGGSGQSVVWYTGFCGSNQIIGQGNPLTIAAPTTTTTYFAQWTNSCANSNCANVQVVVKSNPVASFTGLDAYYCEGSAADTLHGNFTTNSSFTGTGGVSTTGGVTTFNPAGLTNGTTYSVTYTYTAPNGCSDDTTMTTFIREKPFVALLSLNPTYCLNSDDDDINGNMAPMGLITGTGVIMPANGAAKFSPATAGVGTYPITYTYSDFYGCTNSVSQNTTVYDLPVVSFTGLSSTVCIDAGPQALIGNNTTNSYFAGPGISNGTPGQATFDPQTAGIGGPYTITYQYTNGNNCTNIAELEVTVAPKPEVDFTGLEASYCFNSPVDYLYGNHATNSTFFGPGITSNPNGTASFNPSVAGPGTHTIGYTYTSSEGCDDSITKQVIVFPPTNLSILNLDADYCVDANPVFIIGNKAPFGTFSGPGIQPGAAGNATFTPSQAGVGGPWPIVYTFISNNGCVNRDTAYTTVHALPQVTIAGLPARICVNSPAVTVTGTPTPGGTFSGPGITNTTPGSASFDPAIAGSGTHTIKYNYTDSFNCENEATATIIVNALPIPIIEGLETSYCIDAPNDTLVGNYMPFGNITGTGVEPLYIGMGVFKPSVAGVGGPYDITYNVTDMNGCQADTVFKTTVYALPTVTITGLDANYCIDDTPVTLTGSPATGVFTGAGIQDNGNGTAIFTPQTAGAGNFTITYIASDPNSCSNRTTVQTSVKPLPEPVTSVAVSRNFYCPGTVTQLTFSATGGSGDTLFWYAKAAGDSLVGKGDHIVVTAPNDSLWYYARWESNCGVADADSILIVVLPLPIVPDSAYADTASFCYGTITSISLHAAGGRGDVLRWYKNSCNGPIVGLTPDITLAAPTDSTWYYARWFNACGVSDCDSVLIAVQPQPLPPDSVAVDTNYYCATTISNITLEAFGGIGDTIQWFTDGCGLTPLMTGNPITITAPDSTTTYYLRYKNKCNVSLCTSFEVVVIPQPVKPDTLFSDQNDFCTGQVGAILLTAQGGVGSSVRWFKDSCTGEDLGVGNPLLINAPTDSTFYFARWENACGESECTRMRVDVYPNPGTIDTLEANPPVACSLTGTVTLTAVGNFTPLDTIIWFQDSCNGTVLGKTNPLTISTPDSTTTYYAAVANRCDTTACSSVTLLIDTPLPPVSFVADTNEFCKGFTGNITLTANGGNGTSIEWFAQSCGSSIIGTTPVITIAAPDTSTWYFARYTNTCGTSACDSTLITVIPNPVAPDTIVVDSNNYCVGTVQTVTLSIVGGYGDTLSSYGETVRWFINGCDGIEIGTGKTLEIPAPNVPTQYFARWENHCGVTECASGEIFVNTPLPPTTAEVDTTGYCPGNVKYITLSASGGNGTLIRWFEVRPTDTIPIGKESPFTLFAPQVTTTYLVRNENICGVSDYVPVIVKVSEAIMPDSIGTERKSYCNIENGNIMLWVIGGNGDTVKWYVDGCRATLVGIGDTLIAPIPPTTTTYYANWNSSCGITACVEREIVIKTMPTVIVGPNDSICADETYTFKNVVSNDCISREWTTSGDGVFDDPTDKNPTYTPGVNDIKNGLPIYLKLTSTGAAPCGYAVDSMQLTLMPLPNIIVTQSDTSVCRDSLFTLVASGASVYTWNNTPTLDTLNGPIVKGYPTLTETFVVRGRSNFGCRDTAAVTVKVVPRPFVNLGEDLFIFTCEPITLDAGISTGNQFYMWDNYTQSRKREVTESGIYYVTVSNEGCAVSDTIVVNMCNSGVLTAPDAFTPNGDGINDVYRFISSDPTMKFNLTIFDRHGMVIYQSDDINAGWDGYSNGKACPSGVYIYMVKFVGSGTSDPGTEKILTGKIVLVK